MIGTLWRYAQGMIDVLLEVGEEGPDLVLEGGDLAVDDGPSTAVILSLFCDRRATEDDKLPETERDPRGWWAEEPGDRWGSHLWLGERRAANAHAARLAQDRALEALAWAVEDGLVERVETAGEAQAGGRIILDVTLVRGTAKRWPSVWERTAAGKDVRELGGSSFRILYR